MLTEGVVCHLCRRIKVDDWLAEPTQCATFASDLYVQGAGQMAHSFSCSVVCTSLDLATCVRTNTAAGQWLTCC